MKITKYIAFILLFGVGLQCKSQSKDEGWLKRNWNDMIAHYNIYFNAEQKLLAAVDDLAQRHKDDFSKYLTIYPYGSEKDAKNQRNTLEEVMKKSSKVIQHRPHSKWVDDSYFLIGQTHFFGGDYFSAIETFQFVNSNFSDEEIKAMSQLWLMKSYIQKGQYDDAESILGMLSEKPSEFKTFTTHLNLSGGDLLVKQGKYNEAIPYLVKGLKTVKDRRLKYRTNFLLGQLYLNAEKFEDANKHFIRVLKQNAPYEYVFQANLGMAKSTAQSGGQGAKNTTKYLRRMLDDDKNIEYFDQIYYELALLQFNLGNDEEALQNMMNSSKYAGKNNTQRTKTYLFLGDYYFQNRTYDKAQSYYDSAVSFIPDQFPKAEKIRAQHAVLSKLIEHVETIETQDSLLALSRMERTKLDRLISNIINEEAEAAQRKKEEEALQRERNRLAAQNATPTLPDAESGSTWYFYNPSVLAQGENDFIRLWGNRKKEDFWRFVNKSAVEDAVEPPKQNEEESDPDNYNASMDDEQKQALEGLDKNRVKYYENIPFSDLAKEVAEQKIQDAMLGIGKIYFDDLKEFVKSIENLSTLLNRFPKTEHRPEALFYLAKASASSGDSAAYAKFARTIYDEYPETPYNQVLNAQEISESSEDLEVIALYSTMYKAYTNEDFEQVLQLKRQIDTEYPGNSIQGRIDYLYTLTVGKMQGKEAYIKELRILEETYSGTEIGEIARYTLSLFEEPAEEALPEMGTDKYTTSTKRSTKYYYIVSGLTTREKDVQLALTEYNSKYFNTFNLYVQSMKFEERSMFYMKQFDALDDAMRYHSELKENKMEFQKLRFLEMKGYVISDENFRTLFKEKNEDEYISFFYQHYK